MRLIRSLPAICAVLGVLISAPLNAAEPGGQGTVPVVLAEQHEVLKCAAVFAVIASEQEAGSEIALAFPPMAWRGKEYFVQETAKVRSDAQLSNEALQTLLVAEAKALQDAATASGDPDATMTAAAAPCLSRLDASIPPLETPDLLQCSAILAVAYEDVHSREGLSPTAKDLATLASVLTAREKEALKAKGASEDAADRTIAEAHDALLADAFAGGPGADRFDIAHCYELAKPDPKTHY